MRGEDGKEGTYNRAGRPHTVRARRSGKHKKKTRKRFFFIELKVVHGD